MDKKYVLFLDSISRTILATLVEETAGFISVTNPVAMQIISDQTNKIKVQLVPLLFRDLQSDPNESPVWNFNTAQITRISLASGLVEKFINQYEFVVSLTPEKAAVLTANEKAANNKGLAEKASAQVIQMFDEPAKA
jgi:hypothetical protein